MIDQTFLLHLAHGLHGRDDIYLGPLETQIDDRHLVELEVFEIVFDRLAQKIRRTVENPASLIIAPRADLGDERQVGRIGRERLTDQTIGDVGAVKIAGVDMVDTQSDRLAERGAGFFGIFRLAEDMRPRKLHGAVAHAVDGNCGAGKSEAAGCRGGDVMCHVKLLADAIWLFA